MDVQPVGVLLVEDNEDDVVIMREALAEARLMNMIHVVRDGEEALEYLRRKGKYKDAERPGLILLDINMPKKNGFEVLEAMRLDSSISGTPVMVITNLSHGSDIDKAKALGALDYLVKANYSLEEIVQKVEEALRS